MTTPNDAPLSERLESVIQMVVTAESGPDDSTDMEIAEVFAYGFIKDHGLALLELARRVEGAPVAIMDTRDVLGICAPTEEEFPALYALQGMRVRLVTDNE